MNNHAIAKRVNRQKLMAEPCAFSSSGLGTQLLSYQLAPCRAITTNINQQFVWKTRGWTVNGHDNHKTRKRTKVCGITICTRLNKFLAHSVRVDQFAAEEHLIRRGIRMIPDCGSAVTSSDRSHCCGERRGEKIWERRGWVSYIIARDARTASCVASR